MEFDRPYSRQEFIRFLKGLLPVDAQLSEYQNIPFYTKTNFATNATRLGVCDSLDLNVYEVKHNSRNDARVGLSKDAFRLIADEGIRRALVVFVPEDSNDNYRFSLVELTLSWDDNDKVRRSYSNPRRYSYYLGKGVAYYTPNKYLNEPGRILSVEDLRNRFSVEVLTKAFYNELSDWYAWAIKEIQFPNDIDDPHDNERYNHEAAIRLITRLIFVWFLKQRKLIPWQFFDEQYIAEHLLDGFTPNARANLFGKSTESRYYKAILQNLFFAMLNSPMTAEGSKELTERRFRKLNDNGSASRADFDNNKLMRYEKFFKNPDLFVELANSTVPFLNGGLFDCLDDKENGMYLDAFTDRESINRQLIVPDFLFFGEEVGKKIDLTGYYGYKKIVDASGVIDILKRYNFTVEENTPFDQDVSLDPELLGKVFENLLAAYNPETQTTARKQTGSFYTPRDIVQYMVNEALVAHLNRMVGKELEEQYRSLLDYSDADLKLSDSQRKSILEAVFKCKVLDPACGSGAFPVGMLQQMVHILQRIDPDNEMWRNMILESSLNSMQESMTLSDEERREIQDDVNRNFDESCNNPDYARKLYLIENCIYGVDIQPIAIQISKLRFFISLVIDQKTNPDPTENFGIRPLPNLEAKFVAANSLIGLKKREGNLFDLDEIKADEKLLRIAKHRIFGAKTLRTKRKWKNRVAELRQKIADALIANNFIGNEQVADLVAWDMFDQHKYAPFFDPEWMFGVTDGFDILIANPPYVSTKGVSGESKKQFEKEYGFSDDLYNMFTFKGMSLCSKDGSVTYITPKTFWTTQTKRNMRDLMLSHNLRYVFNTANPFEAVMVDTCIWQVVNTPYNASKDNKVYFQDGSANLSAPIIYTPILQSIYLKTQNSVIFKPTELNLRIWELYGEKVKELYDKWWDKIKTSRDIEKNKAELEAYRKSLKPGDIALLGCLTEGGQGLATANNGKYIAVRRSTKWAKNIIESRPKKLADVIARYKPNIPGYSSAMTVSEFLNGKTEREIADLFDSLKERYGRDIFGQGYLYKIIDDDEMTDVSLLTDDEKENGIDPAKKIYVPYDKGDKDGNRWYLETPFAIAWSKENVRFLKTNSGKKGHGMPVVRNPQFYFREGLCWSDINTTFLKCRKKQSSINDVKSMSLFGMSDLVPEDYIIALINSALFSYYVDTFVNNTQTFQINDARQLPIIVPTAILVDMAHRIVNHAIEIKKDCNCEKKTQLTSLQNMVDSWAMGIYNLQS